MADKKLKLLWVADGSSHTGFSQVSNGLLTGLQATGKYDLQHLAINYLDIGPSSSPWPIHSAGFYRQQGTHFQAEDPFGYLKVQRWVIEWDPALVWVNNDYPVAERYMREPDGSPTPLAASSALKVLYAPLDSQPAAQQFIDTADKYDLNIAYTYWARSLMAEADQRYATMPVMYHGIDPDVYKPMDKAEAKDRLEEIFASHNDGKSPSLKGRFIVLEVGTNQWRKAMPCLFRAYADFKKKARNAFLIPLTAAMPSQINGGWQLHNLAALCGVKDAVLLKQANVFSQEEMAIFFAAADVLAYPTRGEGFGIPSLEAMACKTPVIATNFGPQKELHANGRGYLFKYTDLIPGEPGCLTFFADPDWKDLSRKLYHLWLNQDEGAAIAERAYEWVRPHTWANKAIELDALLTEALAKRGTETPKEGDLAG